ncbi:MAG: hypothetical protein ABII72_04830 [Parcubacteria group bacterium]
MSPRENLAEELPGEGSEGMSDEEMRKREKEAAELLGEDWEESAETPRQLGEQAEAAQEEVGKDATAFDAGHQDALGKVDELPGKLSVDAKAAQGSRAEAEQELEVVESEAISVKGEAEVGIKDVASSEEVQAEAPEAGWERINTLRERRDEISKRDDEIEEMLEDPDLAPEEAAGLDKESARLTKEFNELAGEIHRLEQAEKSPQAGEKTIEEIKRASGEIGLKYRRKKEELELEWDQLGEQMRELSVDSDEWKDMKRRQFDVIAPEIGSLGDREAAEIKAAKEKIIKRGKK